MTTDDEWADALREFSHAAYPAGDGPDAALVVRAGRRRKAVRRDGVTAAACAVVAALAFGIPAGLSRHGGVEPIGFPPTTSSAPTSSSPAPTPTGTVAPGPVSTNAYGQDSYAVGAGQAAVLDVPNLYAANVPLASGSQAVAHGVGGVDVTVTADGSDAATVVLDASANHGKSATAHLTWPADEHASDYSMSNHYPIPTFVTSSNDAFQYAYLVGTVPSWIHDPVVLLVSDTAWTLPDGGTTHVAQVPTFRAPTADGRLMYVITGAGNMALNWLAPGHHVAVAFSSGSEPFVPGCEQDIGAHGCDLIPFPAQHLTGVPAQFSPVADQETPTSSATSSWPAVAPTPIEIAPGVLAAAGAGRSR